MAVMRSNFVQYLIAFLLLTAAPLRGWAQEDSEASADATEEPAADPAEEVPPSPKHLLTDMPESAEGVETTFVFPDNPKQFLTSGEEAEILCGFYNGGDVPLNVTRLAGSINSPMDFRVYVQNWTSPMYNTVVPPDTQGSFSIKIKPDLNLQARDFIVALTAFYESDGEMYSSTFFNGTVYVVESAGFLDMETFFMYFFIVAVVGLIAGAIFKALQSAGVVKKKSKARKVETGTRGAVDENEWLKGTAARPASGTPKKRVMRKK
uniref:Translocon-associated protein subunit alpha n=1 Tax=Pyramimonas obovata TaxID=1411642 RepID=A0A7S0WKU2_9CHLO|mmetsp:Transcript_28874/g.63224  ORF Transcript_28874/g.63224 Transcript_28874/m.63224 type:complete len:264 (+) Transcript_28874:47-838(+)|eukprot:CAMPEP_0118935104 /NCGR_PEP_ID=MMETSP1169-20130426/14917_1 /TAXON_ID=36882 /ORGANISM="Pyramimonas obovata, Strain CCMP722" /LENGTH=263 /DNA_ID=CAMNT_0006878091 /DNA_START=47 /DNA_END=838 /DNA_ORIENTATION=+